MAPVRTAIAVGEALQQHPSQESLSAEAGTILPSLDAAHGQPRVELQPMALSLAEMRAKLSEHVHTTAEHTQLALAEAATIQAVRAYWARIPGSLNLPLLPPPREARLLPEVIASAATQLGEIASHLPVSHAAYHLSLIYTSLLPLQWRSGRGIYYTPPSLAERLLDQAEAAGLQWTTAHILDPAAGAGAFLILAAQRLLKAYETSTPALAIETLSTCIRGFELDSFAAWLAQVFIEATCLPIISKAGRRPGQFISVCDSLNGINGHDAEYDLVIGNPPFGKVSLSDKQRSRFARSLYGHANFYGLFMDLSIQLAKPGGLVSLLTPSSFLAGQYFKNLRALLWKEAPPVILDFVTLRKGVFEDVLQETILATYKKGAKRRHSLVFFVNPQTEFPIAPKAAGRFELPREDSAPWIIPRHTHEASLAQCLRAMPARLVDWGYTVSTGPLVWNRHKSQLRDKPEPGTMPIVWAECVTTDGRFIFRSEKRNHKPFFWLKPGDDWLVVRTPCVLLQRTTAKEQKRRLIAAEMPMSFLALHDGVTVENHLNMLLPIVEKPSISPKVLAAFLNTTIADRAFRCLSGSVAVSAYELESLPLPAASEIRGMLGGRHNRAHFERTFTELYSRGGIS
jgi:adenine-specific DNA-methyltransferase